jgi:4-hydroxy-tetrahydrodipicolinate reductase
LSARHKLAADGQEYAGGVDKGDDLAALVASSDVLFDFSSPHAIEANLDACVAAGKPIVIGTTGLEERHHFLIDDAARDIPVLQTGNTSLGVTMLSALVQQAARQLGEDWDIEILEMHHRHKVDAPSGTALLLGEAAASGRGIDLKQHSDRGRDGITGARKAGDIGFASLRGGSVAENSAVCRSDGVASRMSSMSSAKPMSSISSASSSTTAASASTLSVPRRM